MSSRRTAWGLGVDGGDFGDGGDAAVAGGEAGDLDDEVDGGGDLLADGAHGHVDGHEDEGFEAFDGVVGVVGVDGGERAVVAGVHGLEHVHGFAPPHLADDDAVGSHAEGVSDQFADGVGALALDVGGSSFELDHVGLGELELGGFFDGDDAFGGPGVGAQDVEECGFSAAGAAEMTMLARPMMQPWRKRATGAERAPRSIRSSMVNGTQPNLRMVMHGPTSESGLITTLTREPSASRASTRGVEVSTRRPTGRGCVR